MEEGTRVWKDGCVVVSWGCILKGIEDLVERGGGGRKAVNCDCSDSNSTAKELSAEFTVILLHGSTVRMLDCGRVVFRTEMTTSAMGA